MDKDQRDAAYLDWLSYRMESRACGQKYVPFKKYIREREEMDYTFDLDAVEAN